MRLVDPPASNPPSAAPFDPVADLLIDAYLHTAVYSQWFRKSHGLPPTAMAKAHTFRSIAQALLVDNERFDLGEPYREMGRVEFLHRSLNRRFLLRSDTALRWEPRGENTLFDPNEYVESDVMILVSEFGRVALTLSQVGARQRLDSVSLLSQGPITKIGDWPYSPESPPPFDQGDAIDPFSELGSIDLDAESDDQSDAG